MAIKIQYRDHDQPITAELYPVTPGPGLVQYSPWCDICGALIDDKIMVIFTTPFLAREVGPDLPELKEVSHVAHLLDAQAEINIVTPV